MKYSNIYAKWYGGSSYGDSDIEKFESIEECERVFEDRYFNMNGETPVVDDNTTMTLHDSPESEYPFMILRMENGQVVSEEC